MGFNAQRSQLSTFENFLLQSLLIPAVTIQLFFNSLWWLITALFVFTWRISHTKFMAACCPRAASLWTLVNRSLQPQWSLSLAAPWQSWKTIHCSWHQSRQAGTLSHFGSVSKCPSRDEGSMVTQTHFGPSVWCPSTRLTSDTLGQCPSWLRAFPPSFPSRTLYPPISICPLPGWWALKLASALLLRPLPWWDKTWHPFQCLCQLVTGSRMHLVLGPEIRSHKVRDRPLVRAQRESQVTAQVTWTSQDVTGLRRGWSSHSQHGAVQCFSLSDARGIWLCKIPGAQRDAQWWNCKHYDKHSFLDSRN